MSLKCTAFDNWRIESKHSSLSRSGLNVWGWGGLAVTTVSNLNSSYIELELGLGFDKIVLAFSAAVTGRL